MTTINERVKMIRKSDKLNENDKMTMERFGERLGVQKSAISKIEKGQVGVSDQVFRLLCSEFNVNPDWLRDGSGPMFKEKSRNEEIAAFIDDILKNEPGGVKAHMIAALARLDDRDWARIADVAQGLVAEKQEADERQRLHEELDRQLDLEEAAPERSSASSAT